MAIFAYRHQVRVGDGAAAAGLGAAIGEGFHDSPLASEKLLALSHGPRMTCFEGSSRYTETKTLVGGGGRDEEGWTIVMSFNPD